MRGLLALLAATIALDIVPTVSALSTAAPQAMAMAEQRDAAEVSHSFG